MVEVALIKRRKRKIIAGIVGLASSVTLTAFIIVAFLGQYVGSFTVAVKNYGKTQISICDNKELLAPTTFLRIGDIPQMGITSSIFIKNHNKIDSDETTFKYGGVTGPDGELESLDFLKYTFYVQNVGSKEVNFTFSVKVIENIKPSNKEYTLVDIARIRLYENAHNSEEHEYIDYATQSNKVHLMPDGTYTMNKPVARDYDPEDPENTSGNYDGFTEQFVSDDILIERKYEHFASGEVKRYTFVFWLEGEDENCNGDRPKDCSLKLGVDISGYETGEVK